MLATTRGALLRGTTEDELGDEVDGVDAVAGWDDFPLSLIERTTREQDPATNLWRTVRYFAGRVPFNVPVDDGDRIRDNRDGAVYVVDSIVGKPRSLAGRSSTTLKLRRTTP